jgi:hypothetical protein
VRKPIERNGRTLRIMGKLQQGHAHFVHFRFARPLEAFFGHGPIFGGRLQGEDAPTFQAQFTAQIGPDLSALAPTQQRNYEFGS